jgi:hypothetical protein
VFRGTFRLFGQTIRASGMRYKMQVEMEAEMTVLSLDFDQKEAFLRTKNVY